MAANGGKPWEVSKPASTCYFFFYSESKKSVLTEKGRASGLSWKKKIYIIFFSFSLNSSQRAIWSVQSSTLTSSDLFCCLPESPFFFYLLDSFRVWGTADDAAAADPIVSYWDESSESRRDCGIIKEKEVKREKRLESGAGAQTGWHGISARRLLEGANLFDTPTDTKEPHTSLNYHTPDRQAGRQLEPSS